MLQLAEQTNVRHIPAYSPLSVPEIIESVRRFDSVKDYLEEGELACMMISDEKMVTFNQGFRRDLDALEGIATKETQVSSMSSMLFIVKKPDYLGQSKWEMKHGSQMYSVKIEDEEWLANFHKRKVALYPGDALRCQTRIELAYGYDNELIATHYYVEKILEVLPDIHHQQTPLDFEKGAEPT